MKKGKNSGGKSHKKGKKGLKNASFECSTLVPYKLL